MSDKVFLQHINSTYIKIVADPGIVYEIKDHFTFFAPNYRYHPKFRAKQWNGKISLVNGMTGYIYAGLAKNIKKFCDARGYELSFSDELLYDNVSLAEFVEFTESLNLPFKPRDYQINACVKAIRSKRRTISSPTSSGKSLIIYMLYRWYNRNENTKTLLIVPSTGLCVQMANDFRSYGYVGDIHLSTDKGLSKNNIKENLTITTWQAITAAKPRLPQSWYDQFVGGLVMCDEAHQASAASLIAIMAKMNNTPYRFGFTGTLPEDKGQRWTIQGLFGTIYKTITTRELQEKGEVSKSKIKVIVLKYPEEICKKMKDEKYSYQDEINYIVTNDARNKFIKNLMNSLDGNSLCLIQYIEKHGKKLKELLTSSIKPLYYIDGSVEADIREQIRNILETEENANLVASFGTTSTGWSLKRLHNLILGSPTKSMIRLLQSIGRALRLHSTKEEATIYDIVDDLSFKSHKNYALKHFAERLKIYDMEQFEVKLYHVSLKNG